MNLPLELFYKRGDRVRSACKACMRAIAVANAVHKKLYDKARYLEKTDAIKQAVQARSSTEEARRRKKEYDLARLPQQLSKRRARYATDPSYKIMCNLRSRLRGAIKRNKKSDSTLGLTGCSLDDLKNHIEARFGPGMTWGRLMIGEIEIDHVRPCSSFDLSDPAQQRECFHYSNLQPLWKTDNRRKYTKWPTSPNPPSL